MVRVMRVQQLRRWLIDHQQKLLVGGAAVLLLSVAVQLVYPYGRALPLARVAGQSVSFQNEPEITLAVQTRFADADLVVQAGEEAKSDKLQYFGASVSANEMAKHATEYPLLFRFIPLSLLWYQPNLDRYQLSFDDERLTVVAEEYATDLSYPATDANLTIKNGQLAVTEANPGSQVAPEAVRDAIKTASFSWDETKLELRPDIIEPSVSDASVADVKQQAEAILDQSITLVVDGDQEFRPDRATVASWLKIARPSDNNAVELGFDRDSIDKFVADVASQTDDRPEPVKVKLVDGKETARAGGKAGQGVNRQAVTDRVLSALKTPQAGEVKLAFDRQPIKPPVEYDRSYTSSEAGLRAYVEHLSSRGNIQIAVSQLDGERWSAFGDADKSVAAASTYKPMLMLRVLDDISQRNLKWNDKVGGSTIRDCFEDMIVVSANPCAEALIAKYKVGPLTDYLRDEKGFSAGTGFTFKEVTQTTAADLNKLMIGIENGQLLRAQHRNMMLEKMGRQIFRQGIPAGTSAPVYDKVGFLWDYLHDSAIVRHPKGTYTLVIMTKGESWEKIAQITRQIERILYG